MAKATQATPEKTAQSLQAPPEKLQDAVEGQAPEGQEQAPIMTGQEQRRREVEDLLEEENAPQVSDEEETTSETEETPQGDETSETEEKEFPNAEKRKEELQKDIDRLVAQKKALLAEVQEPEKKPEEPKQEKVESKPKRYSEGDLQAIYQKAIDEGEPEVAWQAVKTYVQQHADDTVQNYVKQQQEQTKFAMAQQKEWTDIQRDYADEANKDLDIRDSNSLLSKIARRLYTDKDTAREYQGRIGGMKDCIADAYRLITKDKSNKKDDGLLKEENEALKSRLGKKNRANSMGGGADGPGEEGKPMSAPLTEAQKLDEYIKERRADKRKRDRNEL